jgi:hypothetical protein
MKKLGWSQGKWFSIESKYKKLEKVYYGSYPFAGVPFNSIISYHEPNNGFLIVCPFTYQFVDFSGENKFEVGDEIVIKERNFKFSK